MVEQRRLGASGLNVSAIALGGWLNRTEGEALKVARAALDAGVTLFDTADVYGAGRAESVLGMALKDVRRESVVVSTKVFARVGPGANDRGLSRKHIVEACTSSLARLDCDYIDLYQAHRFDPDVPLRETLGAFDDLVRQGKVLYVGVSEWTPPQVASALKMADEMGFDRIVSNQLQYSAVWRACEAELTPLASREGLGTLAWSPLAQGVLSGKYANQTTAPADSRLGGPFAHRIPQELLDTQIQNAVRSLASVAADSGATVAQLCLAWALSRPTVSSVIIGASNAEQVIENVGACSIQWADGAIDAVDRALSQFAVTSGTRVPSEPDDYRMPDV